MGALGHIMYMRVHYLFHTQHAGDWQKEKNHNHKLPTPTFACKVN